MTHFLTKLMKLVTSMIDIIIPAYNAQEKIYKLLCSLLLQTIKDKLCIYIIDDCSDKEYESLINLFESRLNIKCLRLEKNSGPGVARQYGIDHSKNEFIMFADTDDLFYDCFSIENIFNKIHDSDYDMASGILVAEEPDNINFYNIHNLCLHANMYRRSYLKKHNIKFNNTRSSEDMSFNCLYLLSSPKIVYENSNTYVYLYNKNSITRSNPKEYDFNMVEMFIFNSVWFITEAEKRNYNKSLIAYFMFISCINIYSRYLIFEDEDNSVMLEWFQSFLPYYKNYINYLDENQKIEIYQTYCSITMPSISLNSFIELAEHYRLDGNR